MADPRDLSALLAEFESADALLEAARRCRAEGYRALDAYTPFPVEGLAQTIGFRERRLPLIALAGAVIGGGGMFLLQTWMNALDYPINVGGRPLFAWPAFAVAAYLVGILVAVLAVIGAMLIQNGLPRLHHPIFDVAGFERVTVDRFYLSIGSDDPRFDPERTAATLRNLGATAIEEMVL